MPGGGDTGKGDGWGVGPAPSFPPRPVSKPVHPHATKQPPNPPPPPNYPITKKKTKQFPLATPEALLARTGRHFLGCRQLLLQHTGRLGVVIPHDLAAFVGTIHLPLPALARRLKEEAATAVTAGAAAVAPAAAAEGEKEEGEGEEPDETDVGAAVLALHGWEAAAAGSVDAAAAAAPGAPGAGWALCCGLCGRKVEVARLLARRASSLSFPAPRSSSSSSGIGSGSPTRRQTQGQGKGKDGERVEFDPVEQHRYYCPWAAAGLQAGEEGAGEEGWRQAVRAVASRTHTGGARRGKKRGRGQGLGEGEEEGDDDDDARAWLATGRGGVGSPGVVGGGGGGRGMDASAKPPQQAEAVYKTAIELLRSF
jgi:hypothetical protein